MSKPRILVVEDGDEYLDMLTRCVDDYAYLQAHDGRSAIEILQRFDVDAVYLDMRFDRTAPPYELLGDHAAQVEKYGDAERATKFLQKNQGLFILHHLCQAGYGHLPMVLSHDFSDEPTRWQHLASTYANLTWLTDTLTPDDYRTHIKAILKIGDS